MTMMKRKPTILAQEVNENCAVLTLHVEADIADFQGHFTDYPLLPGVTQIEWAVHFGRTCLSLAGDFAGMDALKFQQPILPDSQVTLTLTWSPEKDSLHFCYTSQVDTQEGDDESAQMHTHASGRIKLVVAQ
ncbi:(3R)-hydroxymyristoyl-[ACP] dehydratase [Photobacterium aphoticum]|uniref:(3R)-hydroxymyristoyl-[ACP] dehydratase n=1 Tax=Photobacterium aphoticum TaxID=754436 RepID=A0A090QHR3_9GAMM|nr:(3R)-hydroxymyristoyl-[ACP] dehydratase [Photobacterium aphoticum]